MKNQEHHCTCAPTPVHDNEEQCAANRAATVAMQNAMTRGAIAESIGRGELLAKQHHTHLKPAYGCPECPIHMGFVRDSADSEWRIP
jgi:hypothetical protein